MDRVVASAKQDRRPPGQSGAAHAPSAHEPAGNPMLQLQRDVGNQAVQALLRSGAIRAKLAVSHPGDPDELEADRKADAVVAMKPIEFG